MRNPNLFADSEIRRLAASRVQLSRVVFIIACLGLVIWAIYQVS